MDVHIHTLRQIVVYEDHSDEAAILALPSRSSRSQRPLAQELASAVFVDASPIKAVIDYERYVRQAKRIVRSLQADRLHVQQLKANRGGKLTLLQGPWAGQELDPVSLEGPLAFPMPVTIPPRKEFEPIFDFLTDDKNVKAYLDGTLQDPSVRVGKELLWHTPLVQFDRGIIYEDGRLDLCKMVLGPTHISALMDALHTNSHITQFLLGNNIISRTGAGRIAAFIERFPNRMETWYLAGCHITKQPLEKLVAAMTTSTRITNVWLKRNPLGPDAGSLLAHLMVHTQHLRTLDVENTSLGNDGVAQFFNALQGQPSSLRTLYLNANGMGEKASKALAAYLDDPQTHLENLFLASNPIGDAGIVHLAPALGHHATLQRLSLASTGLASKGIALLCQALAGHPKFMTLDLQAALTTGAHGQRYNYIDGLCVPALCALIRSPAMRWLTIGRTALTTEEMAIIKEAVIQSNLVHWNGFTMSPEKSCPRAVRAALNQNVLRFHPDRASYDEFSNSLGFHFLRNSPDIRLIDSCYRTADKRLKTPPEQQWQPGDATWQLVLGDAE